MKPALRTVPTPPVVLDLPCDRCGRWFLTAVLPYKVVLGYAQPTPFVRPVGVAG